MSRRSIYVVSISDEGPVKIGIASDVKSRLSAIQTGSPIKLSLAYWVKVYGDARALEKLVHEALAQRRLCGEWFDVTVEIATQTIHVASWERPKVHTLAGDDSSYVTPKILPKLKENKKKIKPIIEKQKNRYATERESLGLTIEEFSKFSKIRPEELIKMEGGWSLPDPFPHLFSVGINKAKQLLGGTTNG